MSDIFSRYGRFTTLILLIMTSLVCCSMTGDYDRRFEKFESIDVMFDEWFGIYFHDIKVGYDHFTVTRGMLDDNPVVRLNDDGMIRYRLDEFSHPTDNTFRSEVFITGDNTVLGLMYEHIIMDHLLTEVGLAEKDGFMYLDVYSGGGHERIKYRLDEGIYPSLAIGYFMMQKPLEVGSRFEYRVFLENLRAIEDFSAEVVGETVIDIDGESMEVFEVVGAIRGLESTSYVTRDGDLIRQVSMDQFDQRLEDRETATNMGEITGITMTAVIDFTLIPVDFPLPSPVSLSELSIRVTGVPRGFEPIDGFYQQVVGPDDEGAYIYTILLPEVSDGPIEIPEIYPEGVEGYLLPEIDIESDNEEMQRTVEDILGDVADPTRSAKMIMDWVYRNVEKRLVDATSALDVLSTMEGECESHAKLYAALVRAAGIPTRVVNGIVYVEEMEAFLFHAWNEVYLDEWIPVDAAFGQFPADVTHIKFAEGSGAVVIDVVSLVGSIDVTILEAKRADIK
ncbi:MAG: transglutaminase domain-containing protein [Deltaproteobacteria bacterium]|nr:transglutaminase domain-containing protein [Candidatus Zymogenaceae bacterium]